MAIEVHREGQRVVVDDPLAGKLDLASFNEYAGWYWSDPEDMLNYRFDVEVNKPVVVSEFGADALGGHHGDATTRWTEEYQERLYQNQFKHDGMQQKYR